MCLSLHHHSPNIHTSLAVVNLRKLIDSGDIHLMGRATKRQKPVYAIRSQLEYLFITCGCRMVIRLIGDPA